MHQLFENLKFFNSYSRVNSIRGFHNRVLTDRNQRVFLYLIVTMRCSTLLFLMVLSLSLFAQNEGDEVISFSESTYDDSYISPHLRGKHSFSLGLQSVQTTPSANLQVNQSVHLGYNYLILKERKLLLALEDKYRTEMNAIGVHFTYVNPEEHYLMGTFFHSKLGLKGRLLSFYFLSEFGLGYHYKKDLQNFGKRKTNITVLVDFVKFRFGRLPMHLNLAGTYALSNNLFSKTPIVLGYMAGVRYYFFRKK
mgnify:CR=1 FL=1